MEKEKNNKKLILIVGLVAILLITLGVTYAFFTFARSGENQELVAGDIYMHYEEGEKTININDALPAKTYNEDDYFEFTIDGKNTYEDKDIWYEIILNEGTAPDEERTERLASKYLKFTLFENNQKVLDGVSYENLTNKSIYVNTINKNTKEEVNITYKLYMWISDDVVIGEGGYDVDTWNDNVFASVRVDVKGDFNEKVADEPIKTLISTIKEKAYQGQEKEKELIAINNAGDKCESLESCSENIREYRYSGPEVNNYIYLQDNTNTNELWRIIGVFTDNDTNEEYIKVIRDEVLPESYLPDTYKASGVTYKIKGSRTFVYWNRFEPNTETENNNWPTAGLQYFLNTEQDSDGTKGYLSYLSSKTKKLLKENVKYYLGSINPEADNVKTAYTNERDSESCIGAKGNVSSSSNFPNAGCNVWTDNDTTWTGKVGLMYPSDYGYSATSDNWDKLFYNETSGSFYQSEINSTSWMYETIADAKSEYSWTITPSSSHSGGAVYWSPNGNLLNSLGYRGNIGVRPVLNLKSKTTLTDGEGTKESPYLIVEN